MLNAARIRPGLFAALLAGCALAEEPAAGGASAGDTATRAGGLAGEATHGAAAADGAGATAPASEAAAPLGGLDAEAEAGGWLPVQRDLGLEWRTRDGRFSINPWLRAQVRYATPFDRDPLTLADVDDEPGGELELRRARLKIEGQLGSENLQWYFEHELTGEHPLLDLRLDLVLPATFLPGPLHARVGQYKLLYNRERVDSSGKQTFAERSISTYAFTLDRQRGVTVATQWGKDTWKNQWLMLGAFQGDGRDPGPTGNELMYVARWQWAFLGPDLPFSQSDLKFRIRPAATLAFGAATVRGPYTRYSSSGGGQLDGFEAGGDERYTLTQYLQEFAWHFVGYSVQQEYHVKRIRDHELGATSTLRGGYAQFGKAWLTTWRAGGLPVEAAARVAQVRWEDTPLDRTQREFTVAGNVFLDGHNNKLTVDISRVEVDEAAAGRDGAMRLRLQWDVSF